MQIKIKFVLIFIFLILLNSISAFCLTIKKYKIDKVYFISKGKTNASIVEQKITPVDTEKTYTSLEELENYLLFIKLELENTRLLSDISYSYELTELKKEGIQSVEATYSFNDTKSLIIIPRPSVNSNSGTSLGIALQDKNFLGLMNTLNLGIIGQLGTEKEPDNMSKITLGGYFGYNYPFSIGTTRNTWLNMFNVNWTIDEGKPDFSASTGLDIAIPVGKNFLKIDFIQSITENSDYKKYNDDLYFTETGRISMPLLLGMLNNNKTPVMYTPYIQAIYNWDSNGLNNDNKKLADTPKLTVGQRTTINNLSWNENFRNGYSISTVQSITRNFNSNELDEMFIPFINANASIYKSYKNIIGLEANINFFAIVNSVINIGPQLRGILDNQLFSYNYYVDEDNYALETTNAITFNLDIPIHLVTTHWLQWFNIENTDSGIGKLLSYLDFELQISPFIDIGLFRNRATGKYFSLSEGLYAGGFELILYPEKWKSYAVRASLGYDLSRNKKWRTPTKNYELYIGVGHLF